MSSFPILDLVVGIVFIFFLLSIICSSIVEIVMTATKVRSEILGKWLVTIFDTQVVNAKGNTVVLGQEIMDHCAVTALSAQGRAPSYIDTRNFVSALLDKITLYSSKANPNSIGDLVVSIQSSTALSSELKRAFLIYAVEAQDTYAALTVKVSGEIEMFRSKLENWYDSNMERISGTMKIKYTRRFTIISAICLTALLNADTIAISKYLYNNPEARTSVAAKAYETAADDSIKAAMARISTGVTDSSNIQSVQELKDSLASKIATINKAHAAIEESLPIGWQSIEFKGTKAWYDWLLFILLKLSGLTLTVFAVMMGAPFWFDVLNKISNLRGVGNKPPVSTKQD
jgi:hypothetical protein